MVDPEVGDPGANPENFELFDFELGDDEMAEIGGLDAARRIGPDPASFVSP